MKPVVLILAILVIFSRIILGMHTFNEVLFGAAIGMFMIMLYYTYVEGFMHRIVATLVGSSACGF